MQPSSIMWELQRPQSSNHFQNKSHSLEYRNDRNYSVNTRSRLTCVRSVSDVMHINCTTQVRSI